MSRTNLCHSSQDGRLDHVIVKMFPNITPSGWYLDQSFLSGRRRGVLSDWPVFSSQSITWEVPMSRRSAEADSIPLAVMRPQALEPHTVEHETVERETGAVRILIVSDVRLYREALALRLSQARQLVIVGAVERGDAVREAERLEPDMILLDAAEWQGLDLATALLAQRPDLNIVAMAVPEIAGHAIAGSGFAGFVPRNGSISDVISLLERLAACGRHAPIALTAPLLNTLQVDAQVVNAQVDDAPRPAAADLTPREGEILEMIELGLSNKEIARSLRIEVGTVKNHVHNILEKLNVRRRNQAARQLRMRSPML
jgi:two-component system nitrate/nitrite response regulator NarL